MKLSQTIVSFLVILFATTGSQGAVSQFTCEDLGNLVDSGGQQEKTANWKLGDAPGFERDFLLSWQMYSITDRIIINYAGRNGPVTFDSGFVSGTGSHLIQLTADQSQNVMVTVNSGGGNSGTAWNYRIEEESANVTEITMAIQSPASEWRNPFQGANRGATIPLSFDLSSGGDFPFVGYSSYLAKVFRFEAPNDSMGCRIRTPAGVYLSVKKSCIPRPAEKVPHSSRNLSNQNTVIFGKISGLLEPGLTYYITVAAPVGVVIRGTGILSSTFQPGDLEVDSYTRGYWEQAEAKGLVSREPMRVMVGVEPSPANPSIPRSGSPLNLISHGRTDTPNGMSGVGGAADSWFPADTFYVNWSDGSWWNDLVLDGSRFIKPSGKTIASLLKSEGYTSIRNIDFIGHSWGTYIGYEIASKWSSRVKVIRKGKGKGGKKKKKKKRIYHNGVYNRMFVLDPASSAPWYRIGATVPRTPFASRGVYTLGMYGHGPAIVPDGFYGSPRNAALAHDSFSVSTPILSLSSQHSEPIRVLRKMLSSSQPQYFFDRTWWMYGAAYSDTPKLKNQHIWRRDQFGWINVLGDIIGYLDVNLNTDGTGTVTEMKYVNKNSGNTITYP